MLPHSRSRTSTSQLASSPSPAGSPAALGLPPVLEWQAKDVASFLTALKCGHLAPVFEQNDITGDVILELDVGHLKEMGVSRVGDRVRLQVGLKALKSSSFAAAGSSTPRHSSGLWGSPSMASLQSSPDKAVGRGPTVNLPKPEGGEPTEPLRTTASHIRQTSTNSSRSRTSSGSSGHRPAPLDFAQNAVRDPRLPQVYQPTARPPVVPRSASSGAIAPPSNSIRFPPFNSPYAPRPLGSLPDITTPTLAKRPSRDTSLRPAAALHPNQSSAAATGPRPSAIEPPHPPEIALPPAPPGAGPAIGLPANPKIAELSTASAGGSFTEHRALRALEREGRNGHASYTLGAARGHPAPRLAPPAVCYPSKGPSAVALGVNGRPAPSATMSSHPFATTPATPSSPSYPPLSSSFPSSETAGGSTDSLTLSGGAGSSSSQGTLAPSMSSMSLRAASSSPGVTPSLEDLKYKIVKFINPEDGNTRVVDVTECSGGWEIMEKVLRKFGKWREGGSGARGFEDSDDEEAKGGVVLDGWGVYLEGYGGEGIGHPLSESELMSVCHAPVDSPARNRGLTLKRVKKLGNRKQVERFFGEALPQPASPTSPTYFAGVATPREPSSRQGGLSAGAKKMNRASTISIMTGLGVNGLKHAILPPSPVVQQASPSQSAAPATRSPSSGSFLVSKGRKMYNFFGHRPPSELISTHLTEYFPKVQKKVLERTARNSMMRITSADANVRASWATGGEGSTRLSSSSFGDSIASPRKKRISQGGRSIASSLGAPKQPNFNRISSSPPRGAIPEDASEDDHGALPRVSISTDGVSGSSDSEAESVDSRPPLLPPVDTSAESWSDSLSIYSPNFIAAGDALRRPSVSSNRPMSLLSQFRKKKDTSDTASFLTVDEITAHVDKKRSSQDAPLVQPEDGIEVIDDDDDLDDDDADATTPAPPGRRFSRSSRLDRVMSYYESSHGSGDEDDYSEDDEEDDEDEDEDEDEEDEDEDEDDAEAEDEQGKAFLSKGGKRSFKWIKGALIGSGSFGSVFLGMDSSRGLLMAVKQVDIPSGVSANEERKKDMLNALEREIELLKELQHENIVQYLDSSIDASHLNIFLEYVPGGSVTALLSNYGAFEEALVRVFVRQTLQGLAYLHDKGIIHRDIKGANILVDNKGGIKISDFGISKKVESDLLENTNNRKSLQGTVFWMAPEVVKQTAHTPKADIWSVGCLVVEMLTGQRPWGRLDQMQVMFKIGSLSRPEFPPDITPAADDFLERTFALDYAARPTAAALLAHAFIQEDLELAEGE